MKKWKKILVIAAACLVAVCCVAGIAAKNYYVGTPKVVSDEKFDFTKEEVHVTHDDIDLFGYALIPARNGKLPTLIYAHGAESDYSADITTLESLAMSGIACYTFDFYGWSKRSTGPEEGDFFKGQPRGVDDRYEKQVLEQVKDLNAVIEKVKTFDFVDTSNTFLLGSSMGGATVAATSVTHSDDIRAIILQYPAINLVPGAMVDNDEYDANRFEGPVLLLQGTKDVIVPIEMSDELHTHYNKYNDLHCKYVIYEGQPHVFTGKYKVIAAREIYEFVHDNEAGL